jgi:hypothetical protein
MAEIKIKRSNVTGRVPTTSDLALGELAINTFDGKLFLKRNNGTDAVVEIGGSAAGVASFNTRTGAVTLSSGDVTGALGFTPLSNTTSYLPLAGGSLTGDVSLPFNILTAYSTQTEQVNTSNLSVSSSVYLDGAWELYHNSATENLELFHYNYTNAPQNLLINGNVAVHAGNVGSYAASTSHTHDYLPLSGGTLTGRTIVNVGGRALTVGGSPAGAPNAVIAAHDGYLEIVAGAGGATNKSGVVFHNPNISTSILEYVNTTSDAAYFNFRSDDVSWNVRVNNSIVLHASNISSYALPLSGGTLTGNLSINTGSVINFAGQSDTVGYNATSGLGTYIKGTGSTYIYGGGSFYDGTAQRALIHAGNKDSYTYPPASHTHSYLPLSGGTLTGELTIATGAATGLRINTSTGTQSLWVRAGYDTDGTATPAVSATNIQFQSSGSSGGTFSFVSGNTKALSIGSVVNSLVALQQAGNQVLHAGNYNSYSPTLTGGNASGTWPINITGSAGSVAATATTNLYSPNAATVVSGDAATAMPGTGNSLIHTLATGPSGNDGHIIGMSWANTTSVYGAQIWVDTDPTNRMAIRSRSSTGVWNGWSEVLTANNYTSYFPTWSSGVTGSHIVQRDGNGYIYANHVNFSTGETENPTINSFITSNGDGWSRKSSKSHVINQLSLLTASNWSNYVQIPYTGWPGSPGADANTFLGGSWLRSSFTYSNNAPWTGPLFSAPAGGYDMQINGQYSGHEFSIRSRNGDAGSWMSWKRILTDHNYNTWAPTLTGGGASGTWSINLNLGGSGHTITNNSWAGGAGYHGYQFNGGDYRFGFSSTSGVVSVYADGNFYATDSSHLVLHAGNYSSYALPLSGGTVGDLRTNFLSGGGGHSFGSSHYSMGKDYANGGWSHPHYSDLIIGYHTGIRIGAAYSGIRFYNNSPTTDANNDGNGDGGEALLMTIGGHAGGSDVVINNSLQLANSNLKLSQGDGTGLRITTAYGWVNFGAQNSSWTHVYSDKAFYTNQDWYVNNSVMLHAGNYTSYATARTSGNRPGVTKLYRNEDDSGYNVQTTWSSDASGYWSLRGYYNDNYHAACYVALSGRSNRANGNFYIDDNYGCGIVGAYASTRYQGVFAMGDSYKLPADGTTTGSLYGLAWSHPNAGGAAGNLTDHGLLVINNGVFKCAISNSIVASGNITAYSDERLKTNWRSMPENYVARLAKVKVGIYDRLDEEDSTQVGVSAQSFQQLLPQAIMTAKDDMQTLSVSYGNAALASAVELAKDNVELRARIERLESLIEQLLNKE